MDVVVESCFNGWFCLRMFMNRQKKSPMLARFHALMKRMSMLANGQQKSGNC